MPNHAAISSQREPFDKLVLIGLGWGVLAARATAGVVAFAVVPTGDCTLTWLMGVVATLAIAMGYTAAAAVMLAIIPIGPSAALLGWPLYRAGVLSRWAYAGVGAVSALTAPVLILAIALSESGLPAWGNIDPVAALLVACFPVVGAFGGFMAGRALRRSAGA